MSEVGREWERVGESGREWEREGEGRYKGTRDTYMKLVHHQVVIGHSTSIYIVVLNQCLDVLCN